MVSQFHWLLLFGLLPFTSTTEPTNLRHGGTPQESFVDQCTPVPTWTIGKGQAVSLVGQNITVIALLNSSRIYGRKQAVMLNTLRSRLYQAGFPAINFMVINSMMAREDTDLLRHDAANIPVYQEQPEEPVKDILGAANGHILVLDRCGRMAYQVITPFSQLTYPYVKAAILSTYKDNPCGLCNTSNLVNESLSAEVDTTLVYVSDAPNHTDGKFINLQNESLIEPQEDPTNLEPPEIQSDNQLHSQVMHSLQSERNGLIHSFSRNLEDLTSQNSSNTSSRSLQRSKEDMYLKQQLDRTDEQETETSLAIRDGISTVTNKRIVVNETQKEPEHQANAILQSSNSNLKGDLKNWDWSARISNQQNGASMESGGQSVEVVHYLRHSERKKKKSRKILIQEFSSTPMTQEVSDSMEMFVNDTQKLFDWYQKKTEQYELSAERSDILKRKLIEHYSRLLPWLNFRLAPGNNSN